MSVGHFLPQDEAFVANGFSRPLPWQTSATSAAVSMKNEQEGTL